MYILYIHGHVFLYIHGLSEIKILNIIKNHEKFNNFLLLEFCVKHSGVFQRSKDNPIYVFLNLGVCSEQLVN